MESTNIILLALLFLKNKVIIRALQVVGLAGLRENFKPNQFGWVERIKNQSLPL